MLALCGMPALRADVCDGLPASPPKQPNLLEWPTGSNDPLSFKLSVESGEPAFRINVRPLWQIKAGREIIDEARAGEIEVARCEDGKQLQVLASSMPPTSWNFANNSLIAPLPHSLPWRTSRPPERKISCASLEFNAKRTTPMLLSQPIRAFNGKPEAERFSHRDFGLSFSPPRHR